jgi:hypothetical protein
MKMKIHTGILILLTAAMLSGCALARPSADPATQPTLAASNETQTVQTLEAQSAAITLEPTEVPPNLHSSGTGFFLAYQKCFDLDAGRQTSETDASCDFSTEPDPSGAGLQIALLPVKPAAFDINFVHETEPSFEQCRDTISLTSEVGLINPLGLYLCFRTLEGRTGFILLRDMDAANGITFDWKTFEDAQAGDLAAVQPLQDSAEFMADITVPDGTVLKPGESFNKTWRLRNNGTSTWTADYKLVFSHGDDLQAPARTNIPIQVAPGDTVNIFVELKAPQQPGEYIAHWMLMNANGELFGVADNQTIYVKIEVK